MADVRFRAVNWGTEKLQCHEMEGVLFAEKSQGKRESRKESSA